MTLGAVPCSCQGNNANCFKCWGTGLTGPSVPGPQASGRYLGAKPIRMRLQQPDAASEWIHCSICNAQLKNLDKHLRKVHTQKTATPRQISTPISAPAPALTHVPTSTPKVERKAALPGSYCPTCGAIVKNLRKHLLKTGHGKVAGRASSSAQTFPNGALARFKCPKCRVVLPAETQLASHLYGSHRIRYTLSKEAALQTSAKYQGNAMRFYPPQVPTTNSNQGPQLDATRGWGHAFRDNGQFGSHPSHDAMDDESAP